MFRIRVRKDGPYVIDSEDIEIVDWNGVPYTIGRRPVALCRCGASSTKPFCDGTHRTRGFQAAEAAGPESAAPQNPQRKTE